MQVLWRCFRIGIALWVLAFHSQGSQASFCTPIPPAEWGGLQAWQEQIYREEMVPECSFFSKNGISQGSSSALTNSAASASQISAQIPGQISPQAVPQVLPQAQATAAPSSSWVATASTQNPPADLPKGSMSVEEKPHSIGVGISNASDWDLSSVQQYLAFYGPSFFKPKESPIPVLVWIQPIADCTTCQEAQDVLKLWVTLSFQRRGLKPTILNEGDFPLPTSGIRHEKDFWSLVNAQQALGGLWVEWPVAFSNDALPNEGIEWSSVSERRPLLKLVLKLGTHNKDEPFVQKVGKLSVDSPSSLISSSLTPSSSTGALAGEGTLARPDEILQVHPAPCELLGVEGVRTTVRRFLMEVWMELGAQFQKREKKLKSMERPQEVFVTLSGFQNFAQYSQAQSLIQSEWSRVCESLKFFGIDSTPVLALQELSQGRAVWVSSISGLMNPVKPMEAASPAGAVGVPQVASQTGQMTLGAFLKKQFHVPGVLQSEGPLEVKLEIP